MATLRTYHAKRDFGKTAEPRGKAGRKKGYRLRHPEARRRRGCITICGSNSTA